MKERIIVTLTTWSKRIQNIPEVLDTIYGQTIPPDHIVLNLAYNEAVPENVQHYIDSHQIEVNRVPDTKVYKKLIPTLKKYPNDCVITIDDDWLYPQDMIADFINIHKHYPNNPISGNRIVSEYLHCQCHCGCASLIKASFLGDYIDAIDEDVILHCPSDDLVYTFFTAKAGCPYIRTHNEFYVNMQPYNNNVAYSEGNNSYVIKSFNYLIKRFGPVNNNIYLGYVDDEVIADQINEIHSKLVEQYQRIINSNTYKLALKFQKLLGIIRRK